MTATPPAATPTGTRWWNTCVPAWALLLFVVTTAIGVAAYAITAGKARANGLAADQLAATQDTTRFVARLVVARDSLHRALDTVGVYQRRATQIAPLQDSLHAALKQTVALQALLAIAPRVDTLHDSVAVGVDAQGNRSAHVEQYQAPFRLWTDVTLPAPPRPGVVSTIVALDTIRLTPRLVCGAAVNGIRPASIEVAGPTWARLGLSQATVDPQACNPQRFVVVGTLKLPWWTNLLAAAGGFLGGYAAHSH